MWDTFTVLKASFDSEVQSVFDIIFSAAFVVPLLFLLLIIIYFLQIHNAKVIQSQTLKDLFALRIQNIQKYGSNIQLLSSFRSTSKMISWQTKLKSWGKRSPSFWKKRKTVIMSNRNKFSFLKRHPFRITIEFLLVRHSDTSRFQISQIIVDSRLLPQTAQACFCFLIFCQ